MARLVKIVAFGKDYCLQPVHSNYARKDRGTSCVWQLSLFFDFFIASLNHHCFSCEASGRIFCFIGKFVLKESSPVSLSSLACIDHRAEGFDADRA